MCLVITSPEGDDTYGKSCFSGRENEKGGGDLL